MSYLDPQFSDARAPIQIMPLLSAKLCEDCATISNSTTHYCPICGGDRTMHTESPALRAALHVIDPVMASVNPTQAVIAAKCAGLMIGYHSRWQNDQYRINEVECFVESDLFHRALEAYALTLKQQQEQSNER